MIIEVCVLRNVPGHPVSRSSDHEKVENAVVNGCTAARLATQIEASKAQVELPHKAWLSRVIFEPGAHVEKVSRCG
jgi:hypothetical protein